ncbi:MAG: elongator complex protein 3 [Bacillota bacterium]
MSTAINKLILEAVSTVETRDDLSALKRKICKEYKLHSIQNTEIIREYKEMIKSGLIDGNLPLEMLLRKRSVRTMSGIAPVAVLSKPYPCPGTCAYCPRLTGVPVSYLPNEPAVMRAIRCKYDPYEQVRTRLRSLEDNGHRPEKIELIVIGGTWSYLPDKYKFWYVANCFKAANEFNSGKESRAMPKNYSLAKLKAILLTEQSKNENARYRVIGLTLETRPDYVSEKEALQMRVLGCTRVEIGVQAVDDDILRLNKRGHGVDAIAQATTLLKRYGFKVTYHLMPGLPGSSAKKDLIMFKQIFSDSRFQPDQIKFYPTVVTEGSLLFKWYKEGKYKPYSDNQLIRLIIACKESVPRYVRIIRLIRDIPAESIIAGNKDTNLRQLVQKQGVHCSCIRCREPKEGVLIGPMSINIQRYQASLGEEVFISFDSTDGKTLYGFCRLRIDPASQVAPAIIRELHVYGELAPIGTQKTVQHRGLGRKLLAHAEEIAIQSGAQNIAVISGVGVRGYYRKNGYRLKGGYMCKKLINKA